MYRVYVNGKFAMEVATMEVAQEESKNLIQDELDSGDNFGVAMITEIDQNDEDPYEGTVGFVANDGSEITYTAYGEHSKSVS